MPTLVTSSIFWAILLHLPGDNVMMEPRPLAKVFFPSIPGTFMIRVQGSFLVEVRDERESWGIIWMIFLKKATFPPIVLDLAIWLWEFAGECSLTIKFKQMINPSPSHTSMPAIKMLIRTNLWKSRQASVSERAKTGKVNEMNGILPLVFLALLPWLDVHHLKFSKLPYTVLLPPLATCMFNHTWLNGTTKPRSHIDYSMITDNSLF